MNSKILIGVFCATIGVLCTPILTMAESSDSADMYRLYNPNSGEHFYTQESSERDNLVKEGWSYEGIGWTAPTKDNMKTQVEPVYRLYNSNAGDHFYTINVNERDNLIQNGWKDEGIGWYSSKNEEVPIYRQYNPNAKSAGSHNFTKDLQENNWLVNAGWKSESVGWYGIGAANNSNSPVSYSNEKLPVVVDQGFSTIIDTGMYISVGAKIYNPNSDSNVKMTRLAILLYRSDGTIFDSRGVSVIIPANTTIPFGCMFSTTRGEVPNRVEVRVEQNTFSTVRTDVIDPKDYTISDVVESSPYTNSLKLKGKILSHSNRDADYPSLSVVFYRNGKIVGGEFSEMYDILAGSSVNFDKTFFEIPDYTTKELGVVRINGLL